MGGFAEDALLFHRITGQHADLDVLVIRPQLNQQLQQLTALGLAKLSTSLEEAPSHHLILGARVDSPHIEIWVSTPEPSGGYSFEVDGQPPSSRYRIFLPEDTFHYPATMIEGIAIQTVSPLALYQLRVISAMTRHVGEKRAQDLAMQEQLPHQLVDVALAGTDGAERDDFGLPIVGHIRHRAALLMDIQPDEKGATLCQG